MTRIDQHVAHLPQVRAAEKPEADHGRGMDFLDHLRGDKPAMGGQAGRQDAGTPLPDERQADASSQATVIRPGVPGDAAAGASTDEVDAGATVQADTPFQAARHAPIGVAEAALHARLFEQHWFANGYLSFLADAERTQAPAANGRADAAPGEPIAAMTTAEAAAPAASMSIGVPGGMDPVSWPVALDSLAHAADAPARSIERLARTLGPLVAADQPWPERLLRVSQKPDGTASLWVRDYTLAPQAIGPLVAHLRQLALQGGVALERVVVNGSLVWHSESIKGEA
jgi:hypothetical protein